uniref:ANK_REP_REGION domain-containing protein n=1 Tax=Glossina austeni TaxID=7395 RepID=A0A1A9VJ21_GLOAU
MHFGISMGICVTSSAGITFFQGPPSEKVPNSVLMLPSSASSSPPSETLCSSSSFNVSIDKVDEAVIKRDDKNLALLLKKEKLWSRVIFKSGTTPLHLAAAKGYSRCLIILCESANQIQLKTGPDVMNNAKINKHRIAPRYTATFPVIFISSHCYSICEDVGDNDDLWSISFNIAADINLFLLDVGNAFGFLEY